MEQEKNLDLQLWLACAGPLVKIPSVDSRVFYFAQGHLEHANAPPGFNAPRVPPLILCQVVAVKYLVDAETDQVNAKITLLPLKGNDPEDQEDNNTIPGPSLVDVRGYANKLPTSFAKLLAEYDVRDGSLFLVPRMLADSIFPPLDYTKNPPYQTIVAKDIHGQTWTFRHDYMGKPRRHILTTGWNAFVKQKKLTPGDSVIFLRSESGELCVGTRRAKHGGPGLDNSISALEKKIIISKWNMMVQKRDSRSCEANKAGMTRVEEVAEALWRAACGQAFEVVYYPRASTPEFFVEEADVRAAKAVKWCGGMRFKMAFEIAESSGINSFEGTVSNVIVLDSVRWPDSPWRMLEVVWDEQHHLLSNLKHLSPWVVELLPNMPASLSHVYSTKPPPASQQFHDLDGDDGSSVTDRNYQQSTQTTSFAVPDWLSDAKRSSAIEGSEDSGSGSSSCVVFGTNLLDNPLHNVAQTSYLKATEEMTPETGCMLVFSEDDDEVLGFIRSISKKLQEGEVSPLTYNLSEITTMETLDRFSVGIVALSFISVCTSQSLDHLADIVDHWKAKTLAIIPVYFKASLSDICGLEGWFETAFQPYLKAYSTARVQRWKAAIAEIASIDGHEWTKETQGRVTEEVVREACLRLYLKNSKNMVKILALLKHSQPSEADIVGIWGMAGIGKTSIAKEVFSTLAPHYDLCYFLQDFYLTCRTRGLRQMREDFYSKIFGEEKLSIIASSDIKPSFMRNLFQNKTILLVLDDVSNARDAEAVVGGFGWFSQGHRVILTSRRKQVLVQCKVKELFEIQKLCDFESLRLCKQYLNGESGIISGTYELL